MMARNFTASQSNNWLAHYAPGETVQKDGNEGEVEFRQQPCYLPRTTDICFTGLTPIQLGNESHAFEMHRKKYHIYPVDQISIEIICVGLGFHVSCQRMTVMAILVNHFFFF